MKWKGILGFIFIAVAMILTIVSMATLAWFTEKKPDGSEVYYGLVQQRECNGDSCHTTSISCNDALDRICDGGKEVIAIGIVSLVVGLAGFVLAYCAHRKGRNVFRFAAIMAWACAGLLAILAAILYSKKTLYLDYSFIIYLFAAFSSIVGVTMVMYGPGVRQSTT